MTRQEELIAEGVALAADYYVSYAVNDGKKILEVFSEYFALTKDDNVVDKRMVGAAMLISDIFYRDPDEVDDDIRYGVEDVIYSLHAFIGNWCPDYEGRILNGEQFKYGYSPSVDYDELLEWVKSEM